ncbi:uncharacterized protein BDZ99DRAFT_568237 [Mytilinidion resinicola]|uniref:F-box domain-containing protein n=1 Tax=Mytilinidion resinicola TaxID=574789 RepID=A0A6A6YYD7_9PEZI|nr:uncharacterized protein BDZ99DRAFT_568237 [Mytilinidion resinicola]KAF2812957.1 hypothetical protein BDZ99DRAFT_568237 [Mytilinidion resinicola]
MKQMLNVLSRRVSNSTSDNLFDTLLESTKTINPQQQCPLFSRLPRELRDEVFAYALLNTCHDPFHRGFPQSERASKKHDIALPLLLTCRAVYSETRYLPISLNAISVGNNASKKGDIAPSFPKRPHQLPERLGNLLHNHAQAIDYTLMQTFLEVGYHFQSFTNFLTGPEPVKYLTLRLERMDWWTWETAPGDVARDGGLALDQSVGAGSVENRPTAGVMRELAQRRRERGRLDGVAIARDEDGAAAGWGVALSRDFPGLKELEMVFESFRAKKAQLEEVVRCAETWEFGMGEEFVLRCVGVERGSWEGGEVERKVEWQRGPFEVTVVRWRRVRA